MNAAAALILFVSAALGLFALAANALKQGDCEVCISVLTKFKDSLTKPILSKPEKIDAAFKEWCSDVKAKDNRFCYYIGGTEDAATGILSEMSKPMSWGMPMDKICEKLKKMDKQLCELRYDKQIDLRNVDLKKLKVRDLKKILNDWDEVCDGCLEKTDFIKRIEHLKPKYVRQEL
jgi:hypothetical protein